MVNADSFYANFTNTTFQKIPLKTEQAWSHGGLQTRELGQAEDSYALLTMKQKILQQHDFLFIFTINLLKAIFG